MNTTEEIEVLFTYFGHLQCLYFQHVILTKKTVEDSWNI